MFDRMKKLVLVLGMIAIVGNLVPPGLEVSGVGFAWVYLVQMTLGGMSIGMFVAALVIWLPIEIGAYFPAKVSERFIHLSALGAVSALFMGLILPVFLPDYTRGWVFLGGISTMVVLISLAAFMRSSKERWLELQRSVC